MSLISLSTWSIFLAGWVKGGHSEQLLLLALFSCEDAAQQVLMSSVRVSVCQQSWNSTILQHLMYFTMFQNVPECSRMFQNECRMFKNAFKMHSECSRMFQNVPECSRKLLNVPEFMENVPECTRMHAECSRMFLNTCRMFQRVCRMFQNACRMFQNVCRMFQNACRMF